MHSLQSATIREWLRQGGTGQSFQHTQTYYLGMYHLVLGRSTAVLGHYTHHPLTLGMDPKSGGPDGRLHCVAVWRGCGVPPDVCSHEAEDWRWGIRP